MKTIKKIKLRYWLIGSLALGVLMLMLAIRAQFVDVPLRVSPATTYVTAPLKADGKSVDFFAALKQKYEDEAVIQSEENGFRHLVQHLSNFKDESIDFYGDYETLCAELNLETGDENSQVKFISFKDFVGEFVRGEEYNEEFFLKLADDFGFDKSGWEDDGKFEPADAERILLKRCLKPWTVEDLPMMKKWLSANEIAFEHAKTAAYKTFFFIPLQSEPLDNPTVEDSFEPGAVVLILIGQGLIIRANLRIGLGDIDGAIDDVETCRRLGLHLENMPNKGAKLAGQRLQELSTAVGINTSAQHIPSKQQLERLKNGHKLSRSNHSFDWLVFQVRLAMLECMHEGTSPQDFFWILGGTANDDKESEEKRRMLELGINWNLVARRVNERFDVLAKDIFNPPQVPGPDDWTFWETISIRHRSERFATMLIKEIDLAYVRSFHEHNCSNQLQRITLAMLIYEKDHGSLPPAFTVDANGKRLHSWRVLLLPYLGQNELYQKIRLDEPWDSAHNKKFWTHSLPIYQCPADKGTNFGDVGPNPGECHYTVIVGPDSAFRGSEGVELSEFRKDPVDTILVTEVTAGFCWMDPTKEITQSAVENGRTLIIAHTPYDLTGISSNHRGVHFGLRDGSVQQIYPTSLDPLHEKLKPILRGTSSKSAFE